MFYNTGIGTYIWIVTNRKEKQRKGKIQLLDAREFYVPMKRSLGDKRRKLGEKEDGKNHIEEIVRLYGRFQSNDTSKIFDKSDFGYTRVTVERPLRLRYQMSEDRSVRFLDAYPDLLDDIAAIDEGLGRQPVLDWNAVKKDVDRILRKRGSRWKGPEQRVFRNVFTNVDPEAKRVFKDERKSLYEPDPELRDFENIPLKSDVDAFFTHEVLPFVPDAWMDRTKDKVGYLRAQPSDIRHLIQAARAAVYGPSLGDQLPNDRFADAGGSAGYDCDPLGGGILQCTRHLFHSNLPQHLTYTVYMSNN